MIQETFLMYNQQFECYQNLQEHIEVGIFLRPFSTVLQLASVIAFCLSNLFLPSKLTTYLSRIMYWGSGHMLSRRSIFSVVAIRIQQILPCEQEIYEELCYVLFTGIRCRCRSKCMIARHMQFITTLIDCCYWSRFEFIVLHRWVSCFSSPLRYKGVNPDSNPYAYNCYGVMVTEVELDVLTGETNVLRADLLYDCGRR